MSRTDFDAYAAYWERIVAISDRHVKLIPDNSWFNWRSNRRRDGLLEALDVAGVEMRWVEHTIKAFNRWVHGHYTPNRNRSAPKVGWVRAIDDELITAHLGVANDLDTYEVAKKKLGELIDWHVQVALDPRVNGGFVMTKVCEPEVPDAHLVSADYTS